MRGFPVIDAPWVPMTRSPHQHRPDHVCRPGIIIVTVVGETVIPVLLWLWGFGLPSFVFLYSSDRLGKIN